MKLIFRSHQYHILMRNGLSIPITTGQKKLFESFEFRPTEPDFNISIIEGDYIESKTKFVNDFTTNSLRYLFVDLLEIEKNLPLFQLCERLRFFEEKQENLQQYIWTNLNYITHPLTFDDQTKEIEIEIELIHKHIAYIENRIEKNFFNLHEVYEGLKSLSALQRFLGYQIEAYNKVNRLYMYLWKYFQQIRKHVEISIQSLKKFLHKNSVLKEKPCCIYHSELY